MEMFTATPQLSAADRRVAMFEGRQFAKAETGRKSGPSASQIAFAHRSLEHMGIAIIMGGSTREELHWLHNGMRAGTDRQLDRPLAMLAENLRSLSWGERREAWRLFGQGFVL